MNVRIKTQFIVNGVIVHEEYTDLLVTSIDGMKAIIAQEMECDYSSITVKNIEPSKDLGDYDVDEKGIVDWKACYFQPFTGVGLPFEIGSDEYLDALSKGNLEDYLIFVE